MGLRTNMTRQLGMAINSIAIGYDGISEVTSWIGKETTGQPRWNEQIHYSYDAAGNMLYRSNNWTVLSIGSYNNINEPSDYVTSGSFTAVGSLSAPATNVTINGYAAEVYSDLTFANTNIAIDYYQTGYFTNVAQNIYGLKTTNQYAVTWINPFDYNPDGSTDGASSIYFTYDEFGHVADISYGDASGYHYAQLTWDGLGRCRSVQYYTLTNDSTGNWWVGPFNQVRYIYDGMAVVQERDSNNTPLVTYTRGLDMSGSLQGAGGIGGLLARTDSNGPAFDHADGNGNVTALMDSYQRIAARYEYDPYGRLLGKWGRLADANTYRFSSKQYFQAFGMYNFDCRFYMPEMARWPNPDPIGEAGGINLYGFVGNNPVNFVDTFGLTTYYRETPFNQDQAGSYGPYSFTVDDGSDNAEYSSWTTDPEFFGNDAMETQDGMLMAMVAPIADPVGMAFGAAFEFLSKPIADALESLGLRKPPIPKTPKASPCPVSIKPEPKITLYRQGNPNTVYSPTRATSLSKSPDLMHYDPKGQLLQFEIPQSVYNQWMKDGLIDTYSDLHALSGIITSEVKVLPPASGQLNQYQVKPQ